MTSLKNLFNGASTKFLTAVIGAAGAAVVGGVFDWRVFAAGMIAAAGVYLFPNSKPPASS